VLISRFLLFFSLAMIAKLPGSGNYKTFAYEVALLKEFVSDDHQPRDGTTQSARHKQRKGNGITGSFRGSFRGSSLFFSRKKNQPDHFDSSVHSEGSLRGRNNSNQPKRGNASSVHGSGNLFKEWKSGGMKNPRQGGKQLDKVQSEAAFRKNSSR
jgi:hypothetical protein